MKIMVRVEGLNKRQGEDELILSLSRDTHLLLWTSMLPRDFRMPIL
jgi:hypothetical protein